MSERFEQKLEDLTSEDLLKEVKFLHLPFFMSKLFMKDEVTDISEVDQTLSYLKAALIFKGIDFGIIFAEDTGEDEKKPSKGRRPKKSKNKKEG